MSQEPMHTPEPSSAQDDFVLTQVPVKDKENKKTEEEDPEIEPPLFSAILMEQYKTRWLSSPQSEEMSEPEFKKRRIQLHEISAFALVESNRYSAEMLKKAGEIDVKMGVDESLIQMMEMIEKDKKKST